MATKTGELRETLLSAIEDIKSGKMKTETAKTISMLAAQINNSLQVEVNAMKELRALGIKVDAVGSNGLGETAPAARLR